MIAAKPLDDRQQVLYDPACRESLRVLNAPHVRALPPSR